MPRLRGKVPKRRHRATKDELRGGGWAFYLDKGMPWLADFIARAGAAVISAEEAAGADAPDYPHLNWARKEGRVFVTRDEERARSEQANLVGSPGILVLKAHTGTGQDLTGLFTAAILAIQLPDRFRARVVIASRGQMKVHEADGTSWSVAAL